MTYWTAIVASNGIVRPTFAIPSDTLKGVRKGRAAVRAALDIAGLRRMTDATLTWLEDDSVTAGVVVIAPDNRVFEWSSRSGYVRLAD